MLRSQIYHEEVGRLRDGAAEKQNEWDAWKADTGEKPSEQYMKEIVGEPLSESEISRIASARADAMLADRLSLDDQPVADHLAPADNIQAVKQENVEIENKVEPKPNIFKSKEEIAAMEAAKNKHTMDNPSQSNVLPENKIDTGNYVLTSTHNVHYSVERKNDKPPEKDLNVSEDHMQVQDEDNALKKMFEKSVTHNNKVVLSNKKSIKM